MTTGYCLRPPLPVWLCVMRWLDGYRLTEEMLNKGLEATHASPEGHKNAMRALIRVNNLSRDEAQKRGYLDKNPERRRSARRGVLVYEITEQGLDLWLTASPRQLQDYTLYGGTFPERPGWE